MSKSATEAQAAKAQKIINEILEPKIKSVVNEANKLLNKHGIQLGASVEWFIDKIETEKSKESTG